MPVQLISVICRYGLEDNISIDYLKTEALRLELKKRAYLAREILASIEDITDKEIEQLWAEEVLRRDENLDTGVDAARPADEVIAWLRAGRI